MSTIEMMVIFIASMICGLGITWLLYDMKLQLKNYEDSINKNDSEE